MSIFHEVELFGSQARGRLFLHSMPGRFETIPEFLVAAAEENLSAFLCLVSDEEIREKSPEYLDLLADPGYAKKVLRAPIRDFGVPDDTDSFQGLLDILAASLNAGRNVLIHCAAGVGRTGMAGICRLSELHAGSNRRLPLRGRCALPAREPAV